MKQTVIGIFKQGNQARQAKEALLQSGINDHVIEITNRVEPENDRLTDGQMTSTQVQQAPLVNNPDTAETMLSVQVGDGAELEKVTGIINGFGADNINRFAVTGA